MAGTQSKVDVAKLQVQMDDVKKQVDHLEITQEKNHTEVMKEIQGIWDKADQRYAPMWTRAVITFIGGGIGVILIAAFMALVIPKDTTPQTTVPLTFQIDTNGDGQPDTTGKVLDTTSGGKAPQSASQGVTGATGAQGVPGPQGQPSPENQGIIQDNVPLLGPLL